MADFANLLFAGRCNARCGFCIGKQVPAALQPDGLGVYPPRGLDAWLARIWETGTRQVVLSGTNTDPQLYRHEEKLLELLRRELPAGTQIALHSNGRTALRKMDLLNRYDRVCLSVPSFDPLIYRRMMGVGGPPALDVITAYSRVPIKLSCAVTRENQPTLGEYLRQAGGLGIRRVVLRKLTGDPTPWQTRLGELWGSLRPLKTVYGCPVYEAGGLEVTLWDFAAAECSAINLYANGEIQEEYRLVGTKSTSAGPPGNRST